MALPPRDRISRIACGKRAWGARLSRHWLRLLLLVLQAIGNRDFAVVQAFVLLITALIIVANIIVDILYAVLDPRITYQ